MKDSSRGVEVTLTGTLRGRFTHPAFSHLLEGKTAGWRLSVESSTYDTDLLRNEAVLIVSAINPFMAYEGTRVTVKGTLATVSDQGKTLTAVYNPQVSDKTGKLIYPEETPRGAEDTCISPDEAMKLSEDDERTVAVLKKDINAELQVEFTGENAVVVKLNEADWRPKVINRIMKDYDRIGWKVTATGPMSLEFRRKSSGEPFPHHPGHPPGCRGQ